MDFSGIYRIQSISYPERVYVGSAVNIRKRKNRHLFDLRHNQHDSGKLQNHYNKYGESDLTFSVLVPCDIKDLIKNEQSFIDSLSPYFNISQTAGSTLGFKHSEETKKALSEIRKSIEPWNKDKKMTKEYCDNMSKSLKGRSTWNKGIKCDSPSDNTKLEMSKSQIKAWELRHQENIKLILNKETGIYYFYIKEAAESTDIIKTDYLRLMLEGKRKNKTSFIYA